MKSTSLGREFDRPLKNHSGLGQAIRNSLTMAYRGLLKIRRTPEQLTPVTMEVPMTVCTRIPGIMIGK